MATNEILRFAETDTGTNLLTQAEYLADAQRPIGNQPGVARSKLVNKALRQSSLIAAGIAEFLADNQSNNITDALTPQNIADYMAAVVRSLGVPTAVAGGTADAITADFTPNVALTNGTTVIVRAGSANATTTPTFAPDGLTAKTIVKGNNIALAAGDIAGAGHWLEMNFDSVLDKWVLQNPYGSVTFASAAENAAGTVENKAVDPLGIREAFNATGSAPVYACRAWVKFNGTGTVAINGSGNVSSVTDNGTGDYTVNFTTALPDANYSFSFATQTGSEYDFRPIVHQSVAPTASALRIRNSNSTGTAATQQDPTIFAVAVFR